MNDDIITMINDCIKRHKKMTEWEQEFIETCARHVNEEEDLSLNELRILNKIWDKVT